MYSSVLPYFARYLFWKILLLLAIREQILFRKTLSNLHKIVKKVF
jgi:hypothetical protein